MRENTFYGYELVPGTARLASMNMLLHGIGGATMPIVVGDALATLPSKKFNVVLSNPPFGKKGSAMIFGESRRSLKEIRNGGAVVGLHALLIASSLRNIDSSDPNGRVTIFVADTSISVFTEILREFAALRIFQRGEQRAVHKPLLVLFALSRVARGMSRLMDFAEIENDFKTLLEEFGPSSAPSSRHYPFWHLATDAGGSLWELQGPAALLERPRGVTPTLTELRASHVKGGFSERVFRALTERASLRSELVRLILTAHFPESLHGDLLGAVGLSIEHLGAATLGLDVTARRRDQSFRDRVLRAYEYRCCVCGFDLRIGSVIAGLEAAHIQWFQAEGPDVESNGLALCALHHKIFDLGAFTIEPRSFTMVFSQHVAMGEETRRRLLAHHGAGMILPQSTQYYPEPGRLEWHARWVFKRPGRELGGSS
ncbi:MAG: hypothetical protein EON54_22475 [Alcaligenaceae bacterium]|nr:MAG: hypothetical protein EON54_22475 [Alcaligenaceae bacterium]